MRIRMGCLGWMLFGWIIGIGYFLFWMVKLCVLAVLAFASLGVRVSRRRNRRSPRYSGHPRSHGYVRDGRYYYPSARK